MPTIRVELFQEAQPSKVRTASNLFESAGCSVRSDRANVEQRRLRIEQHGLFFNKGMVTNLKDECCVGDMIAHAGDVDAISLPSSIWFRQDNPEMTGWVIGSRDEKRVA